MDLLKHIKLSF